MTVAIRYIIISFFLLVSDCLAQSWSPSQAVGNLPSITFRFRSSGVDEQSGSRAAEWVFENNDDTNVTFVYHLVTDACDTLSGCLTIGGRAREYSGWLIHGDIFINVEGEHVTLTRHY